MPVVEFRRDCKSLLLQFDEKLHYCTIAKQYACFFFLQTDNNTRRQNYLPGLFLFLVTPMEVREKSEALQQSSHLTPNLTTALLRSNMNAFSFLQTDNNTRRQNYLPGLFLFITTTHGSPRTKRSFVSKVLSGCRLLICRF